jgi:hypothetical protein
MPERGHRIYGTTTVRVSLVVHAPSRYVYDWCTDYRSDDGQLYVRPPRPSFQVIRISPRRVVRIRDFRGSGRHRKMFDHHLLAVDVIRLNPPHSWHTDQIDESDRQSMDYRVSALGRAKTRLHLTDTEHWITPDFPTREAFRAQVVRFWTELVSALEADYRAGRPAKGP